MSDEAKPPETPADAEAAPSDDLPASVAPALAPGDRVGGEYVIDRLVAVGGMAQVFAAHHALTLKAVAVKTSTRRLPEGSLSYQRMLGEARALGEIDHPNVVRIFHTGRDPNVGLYIVMELLEGKNLRQIMRWSGGIAVPDALAYAIEIAAATHALHGLGIFHRDIKPENVFITIGRVLKLLDLGAAKVPKYGNRTTDNMGTVGTVTYMSPEHLSFGKITAASDVYSLGVMTYEMLARRHVFLVHRTSATPEEFRQWHLMAPPEPLHSIAEVTEQTSSVIARALEKDPASRYPTMAAFAEALEAALRSEVEARRVVAAPLARAVASSEQEKKGRFGTDLMVPQLDPAMLKQAAVAPRVPARGTIPMRQITTPASPFPPPAAQVAPQQASPAPRVTMPNVTPSPVTLDEPLPRRASKIAAAVFAGLVLALLFVLLLRSRGQHPAGEAVVAAPSTPPSAVESVSSGAPEAPQPVPPRAPEVETASASTTPAPPAASSASGPTPAATAPVGGSHGKAGPIHVPPSPASSATAAPHSGPRPMFE